MWPPVLVLLSPGAHVPNLVPSVRSMRRLGGDDAAVSRPVLRAASAAERPVLSLLNDELQRLELLGGGAAYPIELRLCATACTGEGGRVPRDAHGVIGGHEAYELRIGGDAGHVAARTRAGLFYGTRTLLQLLQGAAGLGGRLPPLHIIDAPVSAYRGLMVDNVRKPHDLSFHLDFIARLAMLKLNVYHLHASDDQGYSLPSSAFPGLPAPFALSAADAAALRARAELLHVHVVAEVDVPGHSSALLDRLPQLAAVNSKTGKPCRAINLTSSAAIGTLQTLLTEVMHLFPLTPWHHLGADEVGFDASCNVTKGNYHRFINRMNQWVRSMNRTTIVWEGFDPAPRDAPPVDRTVVVSPFDSVRL